MEQQEAAVRLLSEGGNVFKDKKTGEELTQRINQPDVLPTVQWLETQTGLDLVSNMLGTTGKKACSHRRGSKRDRNAYTHHDATCLSGDTKMTVFSVSVAVGHACTQAPHDTHGESKKLPLKPAATREPNPRPSMVRAKVP